jgi:cell division protein ZapA
MAQVTLRINGHAYTIGCNDGEEPHVLAMGEEVEKRIERAKALGAHSGEARLLVMAALFMADELHDVTTELQGAKKTRPGASERAKAERLSRLAERAEEIAASVERH